MQKSEGGRVRKGQIACRGGGEKGAYIPNLKEREFAAGYPEKKGSARAEKGNLN